MKRQLLAVLLFAATLLMGCQHTVQGFGQDMQHAGEKIQKSV